jgi:flagellar hook-associated protein 3 FlgL
VTDRLVFENASRNTARAREAAQQAQEAVSSGVRVEHPSDDPTAAGLIMARRASRDRFEAISSAVEAASDELADADDALASVSTTLSRARELAIQLSSSTYTASDRQLGAGEVDGLLRQIVSSLNARAGDRYIFGGSQDGRRPFEYDETTRSVSYVGANDARKVEIAPGVLQEASVRADVAMMGFPAAAGGSPGTNVMQTLQDLRDALEANDLTGVQGTLERLGSSISQVATAREQAGISMNAFDAARAAAGMVVDQETTSASKLADIDLTKSVVQLQATQNALQASYAATARSFQMSILDYLR